MSILPIITEDNKKLHSGVSGSGPFTFDFMFFASDDIRVSIDGVETELFTVTGVSADIGFDGGYITLASSVTTADVLIWRDTVRLRMSPFGPGGAGALGVDTEFHRLVLMAQDLHQKYLDYATLLDMDEEIVALAQALNDGTIDDLLDAQIGKVDDLAALQAYSAVDGQIVYMASRATAGDGGRGFFRFDTSDLSVEVAADEMTESEGDGGIYVATALEPTGSDGAYQRILWDGKVTPEMYGAVGDGVADDTDAFAAAVASGYDVECPGIYLVDADAIVSSTPGQTIRGPFRPIENDDSPCGKIVFTATTGIILEFTEANCQAQNLVFEGPSKTTSATAIKAARTSNTDDIEFAANNLFFDTIQICMDVTGRGFDWSDIGTASIGTLVKRSWPTSGTEGTGFQVLPWGWRKDQASRIRFHSSDRLLDNSHDSNAADYQISLSDVVADQGAGILFKGQCKNSSFSNIKSKHAVSTPFDFTDDIADTTFTNFNISGTPTDSANTPGAAMQFSGDMDRCTFSGINLSYLDSFGILVEGDMLYSTLSGFTINNIGMDATGTNACLRVVGAMTGCAVIGGVMEAGSGNHHISVDGTITDSRISGIAYDHANEDLLTGSYTLSTGNIIEEKNTRSVDGNITGQYKLTIADDAVGSITPPRNGGMFIVTCMTGPYGPASALVFFDLGGSVNIDLNTGWAGTTSDNVSVSTSSVAGTTGADGNLNIGTSGGALQFENRVGNSADYTVTFL